MQQSTLLIALFTCHFLADYTHLSTSWMLNAKRTGTPLFPIFVHAMTHAGLMAIVLRFHLGSPDSFWEFTVFDKCVLLQLVSHFLIDVWKGKMNVWFPLLQNPANKWHWVVFGFDQLLHAIVIIQMSLYVF